MRPIFTVHAGEYLVANHIESQFRGLMRVWVPSKDDGVDLLVTDRFNRKAISLQVKFSKDFLPSDKSALLRENLTFGWWSLQHKKIEESEADLWVFVLMDFWSKTARYVVIPPKILLRTLIKIHGKQKIFQTYIAVSKRGQCFLIRGLSKDDQTKIAKGEYSDSERDFSKWVDNWDAIKQMV